MIDPNLYLPHVVPGTVAVVLAVAALFALRALGLWPILHSALSDEDGSISSARLSMFMSLTATIGWVTYVVVKTQAIPALGNCATFITAGNVPYVANKTHNYLMSK